MSQSKQPGYPLPAGELGEDEIVCQLVYLPDRPEYWQAFAGALHYMTTWRAWERDDDKRGKDAAANWREAFELTIGCWRMTCLEQLQDDVAAILAIMQIPQTCCDPGDFTDGDQYTDRVTDGEGDVPQNVIDAGYADDAADWAGFDDYKCMIAHVSINQLEERLREIAPLVDIAGGVLGGVAALSGILAVIVGTGGLAIVFGIVAGIGATSLLYQAIADFGLVDSLADKVASNHHDLACAIYEADGDQAALIALNAEIDTLFTSLETAVLTNMNMGPSIKALYAGRYDQQDIADILFDAGYELDDFACGGCQGIGEFYEYRNWNDEVYYPISMNGGRVIFYEGETDEWMFRFRYDAVPGSDYISMNVDRLRQLAGLGSVTDDWIIVRQVRFEYYIDEAGVSDFRLNLNHDSGTPSYRIPNNYPNSWEEFIVTPDEHIATWNVNLVFRIQRQAESTAAGYFYIKNLTMDFDANT